LENDEENHQSGIPKRFNARQSVIVFPVKNIFACLAKDPGFTHNPLIDKRTNDGICQSTGKLDEKSGMVH
jgi:hypothetical protein